MKRQNFATTLVESSSYVGESAGEFILQAFLKNKTADVTGVKVLTDIVKSEFIGKLNGTHLVQAGDNCTFSASGQLNVTEVELTPCTMYINIELCYNDLVGIWNGLQGGNLNTQDLTTNFNKAIVDLLVNTMGETFETVIWNGTTGSTITGSTCNIQGLDTQIITHTSTGATFSASNIVAATNTLLAMLPSALLEDTSKVKIFMNAKSALYYKFAVQALGIYSPNDQPLMTLGNTEIIVLGKIADNKMYAFDPSNLAIGIGSLDQFSYVSVLDMRKTTLDNSVRMAIQGKADVKFIYEAEVAKLG